MRLRKLIGEIGVKYDRQLPMSSQAHRLLRQAEDELKQWIPAGYLVEGCGGNGEPAITPRIAVFNPDETASIRHDLYLAYLFAADKSTVTLTLNQGVGEMAEHIGQAGARRVLALQAAAIRESLPPADIADLDITFDLRTTAAPSVDHEHANIVSRTYRLDSLPAESEMVAGLQRFVRLYALALEARELARRQGRHELITPARHLAEKQPAEPEIKPPAEPAADRAAEQDPTSKSASPDEQGPKDPDTSLEVLEPDTAVAGKQKTLIRSTTRRRLLAGLVAAPIAYVAPKAAGTRSQQQSAETPMPPPAQTAPVFTIDVSQHDWTRRSGNLDWVGIRRAGISGMCARATYGDPSGYNWPTHHFGDFARAANKAGFALRGGYHNLVRGDQASINRQVDWLRDTLDRYDANWAMLDIERYGELVKADMWPRWEDVRRFDDRWARVETRVLVGYLPPWNWSKHLGQPDLRDFRGPLIASNYPRQANEDFKQLYEQIGGNDGRGWAAYGNRIPEGWQYSSRAKVPGAPYICDVNAWRLNFEQLRALLLGIRPPGVQPYL